jgi:uncharacterized repeat protein (TIGR04076 family)
MKYKLFDIEIVTVGDPATFNCSHVVGEGLIAEGENIRFKRGTKRFSHFALASLAPYIAAKQRVGDEADWMYFESEIACPDPQCGARFKFSRLSTRECDYQTTITEKS